MIEYHIRTTLSGQAVTWMVPTWLEAHPRFTRATLPAVVALARATDGADGDLDGGSLNRLLCLALTGLPPEQVAADPARQWAGY